MSQSTKEPQDLVTFKGAIPDDDKMYVPSSAVSCYTATDGEASVVSVESSGLIWRNIAVKTRSEEGKGTILLHGVSGKADRGRLTCIIGHSGAGKTTLIHSLAGRLQRSKNLESDGEVFLDENKVDPQKLARSFGHAKKTLGYVPQKDALIKTQTPREAFRFSAKLRLSKHTTEKQLDELVQKTLQELRLTDVADKYGSKLSGGEMRRVSLGVELVTNPSIIILDEITSGLDSHSATIVMDICRTVAREQHAVFILSIHQPNSEIFEMIDHVILLDRGRCMYQGEASTMMTDMAAKGMPAPIGYNVSDWAIKVAQTNDFDALCKLGFFEDETKPLLLSDAEAGSKEPLFSRECSIDRTPGSAFERVSQWTETKEILRRDIRSLRDLDALKLRVLTVVVISALISICFWNIGQDSVESPGTFSYHVGAVFLSATASFVALLMVITDSIEQRSIFEREYSSGYYRCIPNAVSKILLDSFILGVFTITMLLITFWSLDLQGQFWYWFCALFLGCLVSNALGHLFVTLPENPQLVMDLVPLVFTPQTLFCGFIIAVDALPQWIRWYSWLQPLTYLYRILLNNEFSVCLDHTQSEENIMACARAVEKTFDAERSFITENTVLNVAPVGTYEGKDAIIEYAGYIGHLRESPALVWDRCGVSGTQIVELQEVGDDYCVITAAEQIYGLVNPELRSDSEPSAVTFVQGDRIRLDYGSSDGATEVSSRNIYQPKDVYAAFGDSVDGSIVSTRICETMQEYCPSVFATNGFETMDDCRAAMMTLPFTVTSDTGLVAYDGNSTGCRHVHARMALSSPDVHCPHLSFIPMEDTNGKTKCHQSYNRSFEEYFEPEDFALFDLVATRGGLDVNSRTALVTPELKESCVTVQSTSASAQSVISSFGLPPTYFCTAYLETQHATGENTTAYWLALVGMWCVFRGLSIWSLKRKATL